MSEPLVKLPLKGLPKEEIFKEMIRVREHDAKWKDGRVLCLVFYGGEELYQVLKEAYNMFFSENALNPTAFPSLRQFETEVVSMTAGILHGDDQVAGNMTSGGTESILMGVYTAREWARKNHPEIVQPEILAPSTAHPAFDKAAHYFGVKLVHVPVKPDFRADVEAMEKAITKNTILMVGSAPSYPHGVVDPIDRLSALALDRGLLFHTDACVGGYMLPFVKKLGYPVPDFDFQLPGVTSMSVDLHKYAYAAKPASVVLYRSHELRRHMYFACIDWPGGIYISPTMTGSKPGGSIAAAWAVLNFLGEEGYLRIVDTVMKTVKKIQEGIAAIEGIHIHGDPETSVMAIGSEKINIFEVADEMSLRGWTFDRDQNPSGLHMTVSFAHEKTADLFLQDLAECVAVARKLTLGKIAGAAKLKITQGAIKVLPDKIVSKLSQKAAAGADIASPGPKRQAAMYGMMGSLPDGDVKELALDLLDKLFTVQNPEE